jgi:hypothetical protein
LDARQAKLRSKQLWHWIYNRGVTDFSLMTDVAKAQQPWLTERFRISRPSVVEAQVSPMVPASGCSAPATITISRWCSSRRGPRHLVRVEPGRLHS